MRLIGSDWSIKGRLGDLRSCKLSYYLQNKNSKIKFHLKGESVSKFNFHRSNLDFDQLEGVKYIFDKVENKVIDLVAWNSCQRSRQLHFKGRFLQPAFFVTIEMV